MGLTPEAAKNQVLTTAALCTAFESAVNYIAQFAVQESSLDSNRSQKLSSYRGSSGEVVAQLAGDVVELGGFGTGRGHGICSNLRLPSKLWRLQRPLPA
jgi:hypothetical protein